MVEVTQQDRDAANAYRDAAIARLMAGDPGGWKDTPEDHLVQAFAQHRIATEAQTVAEIVAWLRERANDKSRLSEREARSQAYRDAMAMLNQTADAIEQRAYK